MVEHEVPCDFAKNNKERLDKGEKKFDKVGERLQNMELDQREVKVMTEIMFRKFMDEKTIKNFDEHRNPHVDEKVVLENFNKESKLRQEESEKRQKLIKWLTRLAAILTGVAFTALGINSLPN